MEVCVHLEGGVRDRWVKRKGRKRSLTASDSAKRSWACLFWSGPGHCSH